MYYVRVIKLNRLHDIVLICSSRGVIKISQYSFSVSVRFSIRMVMGNSD
jgi:hypothetical protein